MSKLMWKGQKLVTIGDMMKKGIDACETPEEAQQFMALYRAENEYADENIGYLSGYYDAANAKRIQEWFGVRHPIFGINTPTSKEAFDAGKKAAEVTP